MNEPTFGCACHKELRRVSWTQGKWRKIIVVVNCYWIMNNESESFIFETPHVFFTSTRATCSYNNAQISFEMDIKYWQIIPKRFAFFNLMSFLFKSCVLFNSHIGSHACYNGIINGCHNQVEPKKLMNNLCPNTFFNVTLNFAINSNCFN